jgi:hypothetical protein
MACPFANTTISGWTWYQGENDMHGSPGSSLKKGGYGCMMPKMVQAWRNAWSGTPDTTSPTAPFGLATIAPGGSEGAGEHLSAFRWAQTANYGTLPNPLMPNVFAAQAYDLRDPWAGPGEGSYGRCTLNTSVSGYCGPASDDPKKKGQGNACCNCGGPPYSDPDRCQWGQDLADGKWNANVKGLAPLIKNASATSFFMGPIHPRLKTPVGMRLAQGMASVGYAMPIALSPVISGCKKSGETITISFNTSLLKGDKLTITAAGMQNVSASNPFSADSMLMQVCAGDQTDCACLSWMTTGKKGPSFCEIPARCAFLGRHLHSRMPLVLTPARLKLLHACNQWHFSRVSYFSDWFTL